MRFSLRIRISLVISDYSTSHGRQKYANILGASLALLAQSPPNQALVRNISMYLQTQQTRITGQ